MVSGKKPTGIELPITVLVLPSIAETVPQQPVVGPPLATYKSPLSGLKAINTGRSPIGIVAITESAHASLTSGEIDVYAEIPIMIIVHTMKNNNTNHDDLLVLFR